MRLYILSILTGLLIGVIYALLGVRSPAPPVVALLGLLGILVGEQLVPFASRIWRYDGMFRQDVRPVIPTELPTGLREAPPSAERVINDRGRD